MPEAVGWYKKTGNVPLSDEVAQWKVRAALRAQDWGLVRSTIERMPPALAALPEWTYWLGRAYKAGGQTTEADALFQKISGQPNFTATSPTTNSTGRSAFRPKLPRCRVTRSSPHRPIPVSSGRWR